MKTRRTSHKVYGAWEYDREIMQMMYPNEDVDSEDFEDGFDIEDFYDED